MKAYLYTALAVLLWSTVATAFKIALVELSYIQLLQWATYSSLTALLLILLVQGKLALLFQMARKDWARTTILGALNPTLYYLILFKAYSLLPAQEAQALNWTWPIILTLLSAVFMGQKLSARSLVAVVAAFFGVLVIATHGRVQTLTISNPWGDFLAIISSTVWASFWIINLKDSRDPVVKLASAFLVGAVLVTGIALMAGDAQFPSTKGFLAAAYVGLFEMGVTFVIWLKALSLAKENASVGLLAYLTPFVSLIFIALILGEAVRASSIVGLSLIVGGILLQVLPQIRSKSG